MSSVGPSHKLSPICVPTRGRPKFRYWSLGRKPSPEIRGLLTHYPQVEFMVESTTSQGVESQAGKSSKRDGPGGPARQSSGRVAEAASWFAEIARGNQTRLFNLDEAESALMAISTDRELCQCIDGTGCDSDNGRAAALRAARSG